MYDPLKLMNEYLVICEVALLPRRREYGICWHEPRVVMQDLKQISSILDTIARPILLFGPGDVLKYGDIERVSFSGS